MPTWIHWIGLPHVFGADPADGHGCDCLLMVWAVLDAAGIHHPPFDPQWLAIAEAGGWDRLQTLWDAATQPLDGPMQYAVTLFQNGPAGLGVGVVVDDGLLMVHHRRGVIWMPLNAMRRLTFCSFR
jgi:hypothetical protein